MSGYTDEFRRNIVNFTMKRFETASGLDYVRYLEVLDKHIGDDMRLACYNIRDQNGQFLMKDALDILVKFEFPANRCKSVLVLLERGGAVAKGTVRRYERANFRVNDSLMELGYTKCDSCWRWYTESCSCIEVQSDKDDASN